MSRSLTGGRPAREKEINEIRKSTDCTTGKMIFTKLRDKNVALLVNSGGIAAVRVLRSNASKLGGIYLGKYRMWRKHRCLLRGDCTRGTVLSATTGSRYGTSYQQTAGRKLKSRR